MLKQLLLLICLSILFVTSAEASPTSVVDYVVDRYDSEPNLACDRFTPNDCSLHSAIQLANANNSDLKRISFFEDATVKLSDLLPIIANSDIFIYASPNIDVTVDGTQLFPVFRIEAENTTIDGLTVVNQVGNVLAIQDDAAGTTIRNSVIGGILSDGTCETYDKLPNNAIALEGTAGTAWIYANEIGCTVNAGVRINSTGGIVYVGESADGASSQNILRDNGQSHTIFSGGVTAQTNSHIIRGNQFIGNSRAVNIYQADGVQVFDNEIRENSVGITVSGDSNWVRRNFVSGNSDIGIQISGDSNSIGCNLFGPYDANEGNYVYDNGYHGIEVRGQTDNSAEGNAILCNKIGLSPFGTLGNAYYGIYVREGNNTNIGLSGASGNVIGGNGNTGVSIVDSDDVGIIGNWIGLNVDGSDIGNGNNGVAVWNSADTIIGGSIQADANHIGNNTGDGVSSLDAVGIAIRWNYIGFYVNDLTIAPNQDGIRLSRSDEATVGVDCAVVCTHIGNNAQWGIDVSSADNVTIGRYTAIIQNASGGVQLNTVALSTITPANLSQNGSGINLLLSGESNVIQPQAVTQSGALPIDYGADGYTANAANDDVPDHPLITTQQDTLINGTTCPNCQIDIYAATFNANDDITSATYRASLFANGNGDFSVDLAIYNLAPDGTALTATQFGTSEMVGLIMSNELPTAITLGSAAATSAHPFRLLTVLLVLLCAMTFSLRRQNV